MGIRLEIGLRLEKATRRIPSRGSDVVGDLIGTVGTDVAADVDAEVIGDIGTDVGTDLIPFMGDVDQSMRTEVINSMGGKRVQCQWTY